ncbi:acyl carrier protein [Acinetobacter pittii]|uniref:acyl carrier protein n=1 Tax=Acinetobacter pittii TaxID=48296 RepID=UPI001C245C1C|nr:acyl carrier protein [Acinetobacter pittii]QWZ60896.1 acyl carrier protein [Acinetobacter pittii]
MQNIKNIVQSLIEELTDFEGENLNDETTIEEIGLASLDYVSIQVALKKELGINIDLNKLAEIRPNNMKDFYSFCKSFE